MTPYWEELMTPRPSLGVLEIAVKYDNVYIKDELGRVWMIWIEPNCPLIQKVGEERP